MRARREDRRRWRAWTLVAWIATASLLPACESGNVSVGVGVAMPAPWGGVTVSTMVPMGPYGGRYGGPMW